MKHPFSVLIKFMICISILDHFIFRLYVNRPPLFIALLLIVAGLIFLFARKDSQPIRSKKDFPTLTKKRREYYKEMGMTETEIDLFRQTMHEAQKQIEQLQKNMHASTKLRAIDLRNDTVKAAKALFKELVKQPKKLPLANYFLYTHLPNIVDLTNQFLNLNEHEIKSKETYEKLEESTQVIDQLAKLITKDYEAFVKEDLEALNVELSIAKNSLKRHNEKE